MFPFLESGEEIDGYRITGRLHAGGMAILYRVEQPGSEFPLVMKVPRLAQGEDAVSVVSYEVEQMMLAALTGPHAPRLVGVGDLERIPYLVMEFIDGIVLKDHVDRAPLPAAEIIHLMQPVATAVDELHRQQLVHLDIKPANIMIRPGGEAVLIDFGLARHAHFPDLLAEEFSKPMGSAPYMAPEQVYGVRDDPRSDIYALGAVMYQMATGVMPFGAPSSVGGLRARVHEEPLPPRARHRDIPEWLQEIILRCLEVDARKRYPTAARLAHDLANADQVKITERGRRTARAGLGMRLLRRWAAVGYEPAPPPPRDAKVSLAPIILVAVDRHQRDNSQSEALLQTVRRVSTLDLDYRIAIATVVKPQPLLGTSDADDSAGKARIRHLLELRQWAAGLNLPEERLTLHVLEHGDPAQALLDYAFNNHVDQIIIGAPTVTGRVETSAVLRPLLGSVGSRVVLEAPCSVTVVRPRAGSR